MIAPTLIVGLGGHGSKIVQRVAEKIEDSEQCEHIRRERISFVVMDTDVNDLRKIRQDNPEIVAIQTSERRTVGTYLNLNRNARDTWFPVNPILNRKVLTEGAGQVRAVSRLAFDSSVRNGDMEPLHRAIADLFKLDGEKMEQSLRVCIVSSLAGGTGAGLVLPIGMYIRNYMETYFTRSSTIIRGFFSLPEIFYPNIKAQDQRNTLMANSYASLREIDTFLMKGDGTLEQRFEDSAKMYFSVPGTDDLEEYDVMPYDFCFLFNNRSVKDAGLTSGVMPYIDHAATCIYAQSIGPMSKKSNSSEDNVIRELMKTGGRSRYAGAGASMLVYPKKDIVEFVASLWAEQCISDQWLKLDEEFTEIKRQAEECSSGGFHIKSKELKDFYVGGFDDRVKIKNPFFMALERACFDYDKDGIFESEKRWDKYLRELANYANSATEKNTESEAKQTFDEARRRLASDLSDKNMRTTLSALDRYKRFTDKYVKEKAYGITFTLFRANKKDVLKGEEPFYLETYLRDQQKNFIHPNAVRYFLYMTLAELEKKRTEIGDELKDLEEYFKGFVKSNFPPDKEGSPSENINENIPLSTLVRQRKVYDGLIGRCTLAKLMRAADTYASNIEEFRVCATYHEILNGAVDYVSKLIEASEKFYESLGGNIVDVKDATEKIPEKFERLRKGEPTEYVCTSKKCFAAIKDEMPFTGNAVTLNSELCEGIYSELLAYTTAEGKPDESFFSDLFENVIMEYFRKEVSSKHRVKVDLDIFSAIEKEYIYEKGDYDSANKERYVKSKIESARILAQPFIESPQGEQRQPLLTCAYNKDWYEKSDKARQNLIYDVLGGSATNDVPANEILFYEALYGLRANDLSKFAPPRDDKTDRKSDGVYYKAYHNLIRQIDARSDETKVITPHLDKMWHNTLPDLDEGSQAAHEHNINAAFFWALLLGDITYSSKVKSYSLTGTTDRTSEDFVLSDGTQCSNFPEVFNALKVNPIVVNSILDDKQLIVEKKIASIRKKDDGRNFIVDKIFTLELEEMNEDIENFGKGVTIYDFPMFLKVSTPAGDFSAKAGGSLLASILEEVQEFYARIYSSENVNAALGRFICDQILLFNGRFASYASVYPDGIVSFKEKLEEVTGRYLNAIGQGDLWEETKAALKMAQAN